ncbi:MAG: glycosyltransferase family 9 protein [Planctomycetota bacterium]|nr:glycosyltransferase family 9 protein [Planctomycetota bacterium]
MIKTLPAVQALHRGSPDSDISWLVEEGAAGVPAGQPGISEVFVFQRGTARGIGDIGPDLFSAIGAGLGLVRRIRAARFDVACDFQGNAKSCAFTLLSGAPTRLGFDSGGTREHAHVAYNRRVALADSRVNSVEKNLRLVAELGVDTRVAAPFFSIRPEDRESAGRILEGLFGREGRCVVLHPGTSAFGAFKRWPAERYAQLARRVRSELGLDVLITWSGGERETATRVAESAGAGVRPLPQALRIGELAAVLDASCGFVGSDSAPLHLAASLQVPSVALFGPKDPVVHGPWGERCLTVFKGLPCSPCVKRTCESPQCMTAITVDEVFEGLTRIIARKL